MLKDPEGKYYKNIENSNVFELGAHERMTPVEALELVMRENPKNIIIIYDADETFHMRSSAMSRRDALWLLENAKLYTLGI